MSLFSIIFECPNLILKLNLISFLIIIILSISAYHIWIWIRGKLSKKSITIDELTLGIGNNNIKMSYCRKDQEIAYKIWVELSTRKIG